MLILMLATSASLAMKLLVGITRARDIAAFAAAVDSCIKGRHDIMQCNYYTRRQALRMIREYFIENKEYTHMATLADDLIVTKGVLDILEWDINQYNYPVLCGVCNVDTETNRRNLNVCIEPLVPPERVNGTHYYNWIVQGSPEHIKLLGKRVPIQVKFAGNPLFIFRRDIAEKVITLRNDSFFNDIQEKLGCCEDVVTCYELDKAGIPIHCDLRAAMRHFKKNDQVGAGRILVDVKPAYIEHFKAR